MQKIQIEKTLQKGRTNLEKIYYKAVVMKTV